jgi:uncharacterized protein (DUF924 family)
MPAAQDVLDFWFEPAHEASWFDRDEVFDAGIRARFGALHAAAARGELGAWATSPAGWLALLIVLDQFSRNLYRGEAGAFACDAQAQRIALAGLARGFDTELPPLQRMFAYLPLEHAEDRALQDRCVDLFAGLCAEAPGEGRYANYLDYAHRHRAVIERFGRFPHRNTALGRQSTDEEVHYLAQAGAGF